MVDLNGSAIVRVSVARPSRATQKRRVSVAKTLSADRDWDVEHKKHEHKMKSLVLSQGERDGIS